MGHIPGFRRRAFLTGAGALTAAGLGARLWRDADERACRAAVFIARAATYDVDLERTIADGLRGLGLAPAWAAGKSVLLISHRLGSARLAGRIVVLESGRIVEEGSHAELLETSEIYADIYSSQLIDDSVVASQTHTLEMAQAGAGR